MSDPNQPYVPQAYPKMLYRDRGAHLVVNDETEAAQAVAEGYMTFAELPPANADGLELLTDDQLRAKLLAMAAVVIQGRPRQELIFAIRFQTDQAAAESARTDSLSVSAVRDAEIDAEVLADEGAEEGDEVIYGSSAHPEIIAVGDLHLLAGPIVGASFKDSGLSVGAWNDLPPSDRNTLIDLTIGRLSEAGNATIIKELGEDAVTAAPAGPQIAGDVETFVETEAVAPVESTEVEQSEDNNPPAEGVDATEAAGLRADLTALKVKFDKRWGVIKLRQALDAATAPDA